jgi:multidrug resistance efflux pump
MKKTRVALVVATVSMLFLATGCGKTPSEATPAAADSPFVAIARGTVDVEGGLVHIAAPREGTATRVDHIVGEAVQAGDTLLALDTTQAEIARDTANADLASAQAQEELLRSRQRGLKLRASRAEQAALLGATSDQSADDARQALAELGLEIVAAQSAIEAAKQKVRQAEYEIGVRTIRAPVAGTIVSRNVRAGDSIVLSATPLIDLLPDGPRIVRAELNESFVAKISGGMKAEVRSQADSDRAYPARVTRIGDVFGPSKLTETTQDATDARDVECILDIDGAPLRIGERVQVRFLAAAGSTR